MPPSRSGPMVANRLAFEPPASRVISIRAPADAKRSPTTSIRSELESCDTLRKAMRSPSSETVSSSRGWVTGSASASRLDEEFARHVGEALGRPAGADADRFRGLEAPVVGPDRRHEVEGHVLNQ